MSSSINEGDSEFDRRVLGQWTARVMAATIALLPIAPESVDSAEDNVSVVGLPEGAKVRVEVNRYERDHRNRAAALALHGHSCLVCDVDMGDVYGPPAAGLIEIHHLLPVSEMGDGYIVDIENDLVPLCPNCHSVAHRRSPPFTLEELRRMLGRM